MLIQCQESGSLLHHLHMHESPVSAEPIKIVHSSEELLVINKPAGIPVCMHLACKYRFLIDRNQMHPVAVYRYNTVEQLLIHEHGIENICCIYYSFFSP